jgi:hypothetical protein
MKLLVRKKTKDPSIHSCRREGGREGRREGGGEGGREGGRERGRGSEGLWT